MESSPHIYFSQVMWSALNPLVSKKELFAQGTPISALCEDRGQTPSQGPVAPHGPARLITSPCFTSHLLALILCAPDSQVFPLFLQNSTHSLPQGLCT